MLDYMRLGTMPEKNHTAHRRVSDNWLYQEHCFTRAGFSRSYSILYHRVAPTREAGTGPSRYDGTEFVARAPGNYALDYPLRRRHLDTNLARPGGNLFEARKCILFNDDIHTSLARPTDTTEEFFSNGDGDELFFFHRGSGWAETMFGRVTFRQQDYLLIPRSCLYRLHFDAGEVFALIFEGRANIEVPDSYRNPDGQLRLDAPYCHRDFGRPERLMAEAGEELPKPPACGYWTVVTKRFDRLSEHRYEHYPCDAAGWDGFVYPVTFPIRKYQAKAGLVHLPPTSHTTFSSWASGADLAYVICSFVPRMVDFHENAIPCPYNHSSPNADEILFYVEGNFISRKGIGPGSISLHPTGMPHGPHPGAYEASIGHRKTAELAVMADTFHPLRLTEYGKTLELGDYNESWMECPLDTSREG
ncbi:homogentisate 1,2-dioxygenase [Candidatus Poribacteria bacterium]|nr:homogentisate 1,2-dioxygenase [Candidatus Poribacteria bacterium]